MRLPVLGLGPSHARRRRAPALLAAAALAAAVAGCGSQAAGGSSDPDPASAVPATAPLYLEAVVQPDGDVRGEVDAVAGKLLATGDPRGRLVQLLDRGLRKHDVNASYARDVEPWLGKRVGVAVTGHRGDRADVLLSAAVKDEDAAEQALDRIAQGDEVREYAGQRYRFSVKDKAATALLGDTLVAGTEPAVKAAVDARKGDALADSDRYAKAHDLAAD